MGLTGIFGMMGSGKTLLATFYAVKALKRGVDVYANYKIVGCNTLTPLTLLNLDDANEKMVVLDEIYAWCDSRLSFSDTNILLSYIAFQSRKRNMHFYYTAQLAHTADRRLRGVTDVAIFCSAVPPHCPKFFAYKKHFYYGNHVVTNDFILPLKYASKYFVLYDTREMVKPLELNKLRNKLQKIEAKS